MINIDALFYETPRKRGFNIIAFLKFLKQNMIPNIKTQSERCKGHIYPLYL